MIKNLQRIILLFSLFLFINNISAESLNFKQDELIKYSINHNLILDFIDDQGNFHCKSENQLTFEIKVLTYDEQTNSFNVEVTIRDFLVNDTTTEDMQISTIVYDSRNPSNSLGSEIIGRLIDKKLNFIVNGYQCKEMTGILEDVEHRLMLLGLNFDSFGLSYYSWNYILGQIFDMAGKNLEINEENEFDFNNILCWEKDGNDELIKEAHYTVKTKDQAVICADIRGTAQKTDETKLIIEKAELVGNVVWNAENALIQQRHAVYQCHDEFKGENPIKRTTLIEQVWQSHSLSD